MRRIGIVVGVAAGVLCAGSVITSSTPACASSYIPRGQKISGVVQPTPGFSVGVITVTGQGGVRKDVRRGTLTETEIQTSPISWVGRLPAKLCATGGTSVTKTGLFKGKMATTGSHEQVPLQLTKPGTRWVVQVHNSDQLIGLAYPVTGQTVKFHKALGFVDDIDGCDPTVVRLDKLRAKARMR